MFSFTLAASLWAVAAGPAPLEREPAGQDTKRTRAEAAAEEFVMTGTVFTEQGFSLPGAEIKVRRAGERKVRRRERSDRRGEFAVRVPPNAEYELRVAAKNYQEQSRKVRATPGGREDFIFRLEPVPAKKEGEKEK